MRGDMSVNNDNLRQSERSDLRSNAHNGYLNKPHESVMGYSLFLWFTHNVSGKYNLAGDVICWIFQIEI